MGCRRGAKVATSSVPADVLAVGDVVLCGHGAGKSVSACASRPRSRVRSSSWPPTPAASWRWSADSAFRESQFNRATQALRQPGSSFKPFVYSAALDNGYTPSSVVMDAPIEIDQGGGLGIWRPENYSGKFYGPLTLRTGIELSRNVMTVRLAQDMGMPLVAEYARRFGIYDDMLPVLAMALGSGETSVLRLAGAYAVFANGGREVRPTLIDRIQDRYGKTVFKHEDRVCQGCVSDEWRGQDEPIVIDNREQVLDPLTAYQMTAMLRGVVQRGTASVVRQIGKPIAGKTGTTNDYRDAWFVGFSPDLVVGVYVGFDKPRSLGRRSTGGQLGRADFYRFHEDGADRPARRFPSGCRRGSTSSRSICAPACAPSPANRTCFWRRSSPGPAHPDTYSIIGYTDTMGRPLTVAPRIRSRGHIGDRWSVLRPRRIAIPSRHKLSLAARPGQRNAGMKIENPEHRQRNRAGSRPAEEAPLTGMRPRRALKV